MRKRLIWALLLSLWAAGALAPVANTGDRDDPDLLCGITRLTDVLFCPHPSGTSPVAAAPEPSPVAAAPKPRPVTGKRPVPKGGSSQASASDQLQEQLPRATAATPRYVPDLLLVRFKHGTSSSAQARVLARAGVFAERRIGQLGVVVVRMPPERRNAALAQLRASKSVALAEKDAVLEAVDTTPNDVNWSYQWGLRLIGLPSVWDRTRGSAVVVAVLDTGVDAGHPDLRGAILPGYDLVNGDADATDDNGHGTSAAGIIAARANNRVGVAGVCWLCSILPIKVLDADGSGDTSQVAAGVVRAADAGARVISMSLGGVAQDQTLDDAIAYATGKGAIIVAAAGNNSSSVPFYPAANPSVISVAATDQSDHLYSWSDFGAWVKISAPGCNAAPAPSGKYVIFCGTSSAAPVVSGLVALELSERPGASRDEIVNTIEQTATPVGAFVARGRLDGAAALSALTGTSTSTDAGALTPNRPARSYTHSFGSGLVTATLTFRGSSALTLSIRDQDGLVVARALRKSPLSLSRRVVAGPYSFVVSGASRNARFTLAVSGPRAAG
jgi:subtilisin family serine protease